MVDDPSEPAQFGAAPSNGPLPPSPPPSNPYLPGPATPYPPGPPAFGYGPGGAEPVPGPAPVRRSWWAGWVSRSEARAAATIVLTLAVVGAALGPVWAAWSPPGPLGLVVSGGIVADETEAFVASDGRFTVIALAVGLVAGVVVFCWKSARGPLAALGLAVGGVLGALLTDLVGHLVRGGSDSGKVNTLITHLPLTVQAHGIVFLEGGLALLVYLLGVAFAPDDDLGRPEPAGQRGPEGALVGVGGQAEDRRGDADAAGGPEQGQFAP